MMAAPQVVECQGGSETSQMLYAPSLRSRVSAINDSGVIGRSSISVLARLRRMVESSVNSGVCGRSTACVSGTRH
jgi:hypothetical protein